MQTYRVEATWDSEDRAWNVTVPELGNVYTYGRSLAAVESNARDAISTWLDCDEDEFDIALVPSVHMMNDAIARVQRLRSSAAQLDEIAIEASKNLAQILAPMMGTRDTGQLIGVSYQRVSQYRNEDQQQSTAELIERIHELGEHLESFDTPTNNHDQLIAVD